MNEKGLIHVYYGNGKGKTTAALGLALRASGCGKRVVIVQFLKGKPTGELEQLALLPNITVCRGQATMKFSFAMTEEEIQATKRIHDDNLKKAVSLIQDGKCDLLVLDEALDAYQMGMLDEDLLRGLLFDKPDLLEIAVTGHSPTDWVVEQADYVTEMVKHKHPYDKGIKARKGIEY